MKIHRISVLQMKVTGIVDFQIRGLEITTPIGKDIKSYISSRRAMNRYFLYKSTGNSSSLVKGAWNSHFLDEEACSSLFQIKVPDIVVFKVKGPGIVVF